MTRIHAPVILLWIHWIHWISVPFRENSITSLNSLKLIEKTSLDCHFVSDADWDSTSITRMHSSRMRTVHCSSRLPGVGCLSGGGIVCPGDVFRGCLPRGCLPRGCLPRGVSARHPPVDRMTDRCKNITLQQLRCGRWRFVTYATAETRKYNKCSECAKLLQLSSTETCTRCI